ncbi:alpha/beta hydrolase fold domain-containing protein [Rhodococcus sp. BP-349]|uniref:alpha/beta hydrolase n=1 Tax=unclassified Rhodococcus (in: high G+C Gram-positive bacteria) TaxID=192944 RepID=UPI001C9B6A78|nr:MULTISPECIES: alpha/beta hydrolase fold domain-containing protein [unclassified Rhodococcus (in: high G+C Gram-positive bacteria)]MBY6540351.1 alpha/beta hydrolase fold domain-containing protein [Rhodococcus sp. BP-363]MBY6545624.1 alpha/beta hydrolase fold domain-containing protein [Rhodococcus sp. BP-369]MBY6564854.1 alpha/beta hydrolase fold domain-containing protein [Rhodococcus sp. BP-370]MBY6578210.1 alpha/beta hydrolase fold domain-containing protein [Rhodococcus sp. BP-364]MBY658751
MFDAIDVTNRVVTGKQGNIPVRDYRPIAPSEKCRPLLWIHGGGFSGGSIKMKESDQPAREIAALGRRVVTVDYRLAPTPKLWGASAPGPHPNRFPAAQDDIVNVARWLANDSGSGIHMGGASAGANLTASATLRLLDRSTSAISSTILAYGLFHSVLPDSCEIEEGLDWMARPLFKAGLLRRLAANYTGDESLVGPGPAFPGGTDLRRYPPTLMLDAEQDRLRASGSAFHRELVAAGVDVDYHVLEGARHGFLSWPRHRPFRRSIARMASWLDRYDNNEPI